MPVMYKYGGWWYNHTPFFHPLKLVYVKKSFATDNQLLYGDPQNCDLLVEMFINVQKKKISVGHEDIFKNKYFFYNGDYTFKWT